MADSAAWPTLLAALGGVALTAAFGLLTAYLGHRWQAKRLEQESRIASARELRTARREIYAKYVATANQVYNRSFDLHAAHRDHPQNVEAVAAQPGETLAQQLEANEAARVEVMLLADEAVQSALERYNATMQSLWRTVASGGALDDLPVSSSAYHALIKAMQHEIVST